MEAIVQFVAAVFRIPANVALAFAVAIIDYLSKVKASPHVIIPFIPEPTTAATVTASPPKKKKKHSKKKNNKKLVVEEKSVGADVGVAEADIPNESMVENVADVEPNAHNQNITENASVAELRVPSEEVESSSAMIKKIVENVPDNLKSSVEAFLNTNFKTLSLNVSAQPEAAEHIVAKRNVAELQVIPSSSDPDSGNPSSEDEVVSPVTSLDADNDFEAAIIASLKENVPTAWETPKTPKSSKKSCASASPTSSNASSPTVLLDNNPFSVLSRGTDVTSAKNPVSSPL